MVASEVAIDLSIMKGAGDIGVSYSHTQCRIGDHLQINAPVSCKENTRRRRRQLKTRKNSIHLRYLKDGLRQGWNLQALTRVVARQ